MIKLWENMPERTSAAGGPSITPFLVPGTNNPAILVIPGGGYHVVCEDTEGSPIARAFNALGYSCFVLDYRCGEGHQFPEPQEDAARAVKLIRHRADEFGIDPHRVAALGFSAGGHLAGCLGTAIRENFTGKAGDAADQQSALPDALVLCYPVVSFVDGMSHRASGINLLGEERCNQEDYKFDLSLNVDDFTPPAFVWQTFRDQVVAFMGSIAFAEAMQAKGRVVSLHMFPFGDHGMLLGKNTHDVSDWTQLTHHFLETIWQRRAETPEQFHNRYTNQTQKELLYIQQ